ncbi:MAG: hypothetical protein H7338_12850 [Candidatus Sericytochromatia bacterium]|nr:hypothetical protein [Candidatus Sericytochromatia bacterium]
MLLREIVALLALEGGNGDRQGAYAGAADKLDTFPASVALMATVETVQGSLGVSEAVAERIIEYRDHGSIGYLDHLRRLFPPEVRRLMVVPGIDANLATRLYRSLNINSLRDLDVAVRQGLLAADSEIGPDKAAMIRLNLTQVEHGGGRIPLGQALPIIQELDGLLRAAPGLSQLALVGSARRWEETIGDIDFCATTTESPDALFERFIEYKRVDRVIAREPDRVAVQLAIGIPAELFLATPETFGCMAHWLTGNRRHTVRLRQLASAQGYRLEPKGFWRSADDALIPCPEERIIYETLGLVMPPPEVRQGEAELTWRRMEDVPSLVDATAVQGDLHVHSAWDDGGGTIEDVAAAAKALGYTYIAITSHAQQGTVDDGLSLRLLRRQVAEIDRYNGRETGVTCISGVEVPIGPGGVLQWPAGMRELVDIVVGAIGTGEDLSDDEYTARLAGAIAGGQIDIIAHPTGRLLQHKDPAKLDWERLLPGTASQQIAWEINANWRRLDLGEQAARRVTEAGGLLSISSDAHHPLQLPMMTFGVAIARRAIVPPAQVLNVGPIDRVRDWITERRRIRTGKAHSG